MFAPKSFNARNKRHSTSFPVQWSFWAMAIFDFVVSSVSFTWFYFCFCILSGLFWRTNDIEIELIELTVIFVLFHLYKIKMRTAVMRLKLKKKTNIFTIDVCCCVPALAPYHMPYAIDVHLEFWADRKKKCSANVFDFVVVRIYPEMWWRYYLPVCLVRIEKKKLEFFVFVLICLPCNLIQIRWKIFSTQTSLRIIIEWFSILILELKNVKGERNLHLTTM